MGLAEEIDLPPDTSKPEEIIRRRVAFDASVIVRAALRVLSAELRLLSRATPSAELAGALFSVAL